MARNPIVTLESQLPARAGALVIAGALAPFPTPRRHRAPWGLTRAPYDHLDLPLAQRLAGDLELGEVIEGELVSPEIDPGASPAPRPPARAAAALGCGNYRNLALDLIDGTLPAATWSVVSGPALSAPCRIEHISLQPLETIISGFPLFRLMLVDEAIAGRFAQVNGEDLMEPVRSGVTSLNATHSANFGVTFPTIGGGFGSPMVTLHIGRLIQENGKRLCFALLNTSGAPMQAYVSLWATIHLCEEARASAPAPRAPAAPRAPTPPSVSRLTTAPAPAPAQVLRDTGAPVYPVQKYGGAGQAQQRWMIRGVTGIDFATAQEATNYWRAQQVSALPTNQRAAAAAEVVSRNNELVYGTGEVPTPSATLLRPLPAQFRG